MNMHGITSAYKALLAPAESEIINNGSVVFRENTNNENNSASVSFISNGAIAQETSSVVQNNNEVVLRKRSTFRRRDSSACRRIEEIEVDSDFSAEDFVNNLLDKGCDVICDETYSSFNEQSVLPPYYNEKLYKRGRQFFYKHIFGLFLSKLLGLLLVLALPTVRILIMTNKSSTPLTAYKRYMATIFHMCVWYDADFKPNSRLWSSLRSVRNMHNAASKQSSNKLKMRITQKDMALTQFGFMGFALVRSKMIGVHEATEEEWKSFIHIWRVVGYILGIEERFNICRESVKETKEICNKLIEKAFNPFVHDPTEGFEEMCKALLKGMWVMNPYLQYDVFVCYLYMTLANCSYNNLENDTIKPLKPESKRKLNVIVFVLGALRFTVVRIFYKYLQILALWLMKNFPFLAYYRFGWEHSHVTI